jgi:hypothetical protein
MNRVENDPLKNGPRDKKSQEGYENPADTTPRREGGEDALGETSPQDSRADEKVIVNEQREDKIVNTPSQTGAHTSELEANDEDVI